MANISNKRWPIIQDILKREGIARQHLNSYDEFLERGLQSIIDEVGQIEIESAEYPYKIQLGKVKLQQPRMMELDGSITHIAPMEARLRNVTYASPIMLEASVVEDGKILESRYIHIGDMPVMVRSNACILHNLSEQKLVEHGEDPSDPGGYFIINGSERVIVGLEDLSYNKIIVDRETVGGNTVFKAKVYSSIVGYRAKLELIMKNDGLIVAKIPGSPVDIPVVTLMRALGLESDREIAASVSLVDDIQDELEGSFEKSGDVPTAKDAIVYISKRIAPGMLEEFQIKRAETLLDWGLLPHLGKHPDNRKEKALFLGEATCKLIELKLGWIATDDKDHYGNKVIKFAGQMLADLFRTAFRNLVRDMKYQLERSGQKRGINAVAAAVRPGIVTDKMNNAIATGNWGRGRVGVTQLLDRTNYLSTISHLRRIQSPLSRSQPNFEARDLHATHFGRICPSETPEGSNCGLVKNLALSAIISVNVPSEDIIEKLYDLGVTYVSDAKDELKKEGTRVFVDGRLIGYFKDGQRLVDSLRDLRRNFKIHPHVGIFLYQSSFEGSTKRLYVNCNAGRVLRPLIVIKDNKILLTQELIDKVSKKFLSWTDLLHMGIIELVDANEEENSYIAIDETDIKKHTHMEVFPSAILGAGASIIPYPEHNQSPRNTYESAMAKQSLGFSTPLMNASTYVRQHLMLYPQTPIVNTKAMGLLGLEDRPAGQNCVVAVLPFDGYNIEDAIVLSKSSIDRGLGRTFFYRIYEAEAKQYPGGMRDNFEIPTAEGNIRGFRGDKAYRLLEEDGVIATESTAQGGDILIGKTSPPRFMEEYREFEVKGPYRRDTSIGVRPSENGVVDTVVMTQSHDGGRMYKIRVRDLRIPEIGDKFASRHGQKGVVGLLVNQEDLPYTADGVVPDVLINPHAFPSRMTVGMFLESVTGKAAALRGSKMDGSAFVGEKLEDVKGVLEQNGFKYSGKEVMYDGRTGKPFAVDVFIGVVYYQKLHHMVADKIHARARGQVQMLTKQPTEGRARGGGLRFGEMERDCLIAYGASMMLKDRLLDESDKADIYICERCGLVSYYDIKQRRFVCRVCGDKAKVTSISVAYAFKLLLQEMMSLDVAPRLLIKERV
ncbi:MAG: DNA-directed RNA polymerase subunit B [Thaumarchaeota archaeon]|uniref:DNA-directed RNA polymerase subunit B n=1 Tax=Candidatus Nitrosotalea sp. FS TaxID=2341021 RepID=UPI00140C28C7|nr:DNA-directed RNA polymerase subunit B [Candidatus Nitrosotalea sp. FS]MDE1811661.1 DNA-directed RNA polymerase subunit B [Nitrososphaerota archaeon]MDH2907691.1 DNA-directed RNA polymerase subunit B [Candidatus Nitrosotalea sp.]MDE1814248.1 DNA-directed RNA polymerase subunit B [Nitrososphaerota archaeon]MDE1818283.1 DNA-directed RNA polymerase subunit B [Nitrososphaerota archaeon]MDE1839006.1 DNA-directed RNA polymerase subunit B [Nitrososphaerota archaeon]